MVIPAATFHRIVKNNIRWKPHRMHVPHELQGDFPRMLDFSRSFIQKCTDNRFLPEFLIGDGVFASGK